MLSGQQFNLFMSTSEASVRARRQNTVYITKDSTPSILDKLKPNDRNVLPIIYICKGANPEIVKRIPYDFDYVVLMEGVDEAISAILPTHINNVEIYHGVKPSAVALITPSVEKLIFTGVTEEIISSTPARYLEIGLKLDITPPVMASVPASVRYLELLGPISTETLKHAPNTIKAVYFTAKSFSSNEIVNFAGDVLNYGWFHLDSISHIPAIGVIGDIDIKFSQCLSARTKILLIEKNNNIEFARSLSNTSLRKILVCPFSSAEFIDAIDLKIEVLCQMNAPSQQKDYVEARNVKHKAYLAQQQKSLKRLAEDRDESVAPTAKKSRPGSQ